MKEQKERLIKVLQMLGSGVTLLSCYKKAKRKVAIELEECGNSPDVRPLPLWREEKRS